MNAVGWTGLGYIISLVSVYLSPSVHEISLTNNLFETVVDGSMVDQPLNIETIWVHVSAFQINLVSSKVVFL